MASNRPTKETIYLRRYFTAEERLEMGTNLAQAHNRVEAIVAEEAVMKTQIKSSKAAVDQIISDLSRKLNDGFDMANVPCELKYDEPNVGEVSYVGPDGKIEKTRPMTLSERQTELDFEESTTLPVEESAENIATFFDKPAEPSGEEQEAAEPTSNLIAPPGSLPPIDELF